MDSGAGGAERSDAAPLPSDKSLFLSPLYNRIERDGISKRTRYSRGRGQVLA